MKNIKKILALALVIMSVLAISIPALAAKDTTISVHCTTCAESATQTRYYTRQHVIDEEYRDRPDGGTDIRYLNAVPTKTVCSTGIDLHTSHGQYRFWSAWELFGY